MGKQKKRRQFTREFKLEAVKQIVEGGRPIVEVAKSLGLSRVVLSRWKTAFQKAGGVAFPGTVKQTPANEQILPLMQISAASWQGD